MCGINLAFSSRRSPATLVGSMNLALRHRGPDADDIYLDAERPLALGHTRLAIQDLSEAGRQPMASDCGRYVLVFNGEIYNHLSLRELLGWGGRWRGHSDTETLLRCFQAWGVEKTLREAVGMFALAWWDRAEQDLVLARDRFGEKPLYYGEQGSEFFVASELSAMERVATGLEVDRDALQAYMRYSCVPAPQTIYRGIKKLKPGTIQRFSVGKEGIACTAECIYWSLDTVARARVGQSFSQAEADARIEQALIEAVSGQMLSDVPLGAFLSGGIDSSLIAALMQSLSDIPIDTFTIGFNEPGYNEAEHAKAVAKHLGTHHTELYLDQADALAAVPDLATIYSEPFADSSQLPTALLAKMTRGHVTVALSGDGGDEIFCGYNRYLSGLAMWQKAGAMPLPIRYLLRALLASLSKPALAPALNAVCKLAPGGYQFSELQDKAQKLSGVLGDAGLPGFYEQLVSTPHALAVLGAGTGSDVWNNYLPSDTTVSAERALMLADAKGYMADDILVKVDRAAMAYGLETRAPLLDHRVVEAAYSLPIDCLKYGGEGKQPLRNILYKHVPKALIDRPKKGFSMPVSHWLRGSLKDWGGSLLAPERIRNDGFFDEAAVSALWHRHQSGEEDCSRVLWSLLMFQSWRDKAA